MYKLLSFLLTLSLGFTTSSFAAEKPKNVRGIYVTGWSAGSTAKINSLIEFADTTEINSFVINVKEDDGYLTFETGVPLAKAIGADTRRIRDINALLKRLNDHNIYPIARIVIFKDSLLTKTRPDLAVHKNGVVWRSKAKEQFLDPYSKEVWDYHIAIANAAIKAGFKEIQWDYVRFPDTSTKLEYPHADSRKRVQVIADFLKYAKERIPGVPVTADLFGYVMSEQGDLGIGQNLEILEPHIDVILPMVYPSHYYSQSFGVKHPNFEPYRIVNSAMRAGLKRVNKPTKYRPWIQAFTLGKPIYGPDEVKTQLQATYDAGIYEWVLWNASNNYSKYRSALRSE